MRYGNMQRKGWQMVYKKLFLLTLIIFVGLGVSYASELSLSYPVMDGETPRPKVNSPVLKRVLPVPTEPKEDVVKDNGNKPTKSKTVNKKTNDEQKLESKKDGTKKKNEKIINGVYFPDGVPTDKTKNKPVVCDLPSASDQVYPLPKEFQNLRTTYVNGIYCEKVDKYGGFRRQKHYFYDCRKKQMVLIPNVYYIHPKYMNKLKKLRPDYEKYSSKSDYFKHEGKTYKIPTYKDNKY